MTTNEISYGNRNGLQDEIKKVKIYGNYNTTSHSTPVSTPSIKSGKIDHPDIFICFKSPKPAEDKKKKDRVEEKSKKTIKRSKSRELRGGILYVGCDCDRRNGLQDQCPRSECRGSPACMTVPPSCGPSEFSNNKHWAKHYEDSRKARADFIRKTKEKKATAGQPKKVEKKHDYECFPVDQLMVEGKPCPICERPIDGCHEKTPAAFVVVPVIVD